MYDSLPASLPPVVALVASRLPDVFSPLDVADALEALIAAETAAGYDGAPYPDADAASVLRALRAAEAASVVVDGPEPMYRLHRESLPL